MVDAQSGVAAKGVPIILPKRVDPLIRVKKLASVQPCCRPSPTRPSQPSRGPPLPERGLDVDCSLQLCTCNRAPTLSQRLRPATIGVFGPASPLKEAGIEPSVSREREGEYPGIRALAMNGGDAVYQFRVRFLAALQRPK
jgi:hypothetical protein